MTAWLGAVFLTAAFLVLLKVFRLVKVSRDIITLSRESLATMGSVDLSEDDKEQIIQRNAIRALGYFLLLSLGGAGAVLLPLLVLWGAEKMQWVVLEDILTAAFSPTFLILSAAAAIAAFRFWHPTKTKEREEDSSKDANASYSYAERMIHEVAFGTFGLQAALSGIEDRLHRKSLSRFSTQRMLMITALPRAGTTLLLECCHASPEFAAHTYRDMPFVPLPLTWGRFSEFFGKELQQRERAHGDGMMINADSPEALEEILWVLFWPKQYAADRIAPWPADAANIEFRDFYTTHMRKIICRRRNNPSARYVSKNNANIARVEWLRTTFPDAVLLIPFRNPIQHAQSLLRQHQNFLSIHQQDRFAATYMKAIGHFDFGDNLRPIDFDGWLSARRCADQKTLGFWLEYWIAAYHHLLQREADLRFFSYEHFCAAGENGLRELAIAIDANQPQALLEQHQRLRVMQPREVDLNDVPSDLIAEAQQLYSELLRVASNAQPCQNEVPS